MQTQFCLQLLTGRDHMGTTLNLERTGCEVGHYVQWVQIQ
jgi:hypothetical protein